MADNEYSQNSSADTLAQPLLHDSPPEVDQGQYFEQRDTDGDEHGSEGAASVPWSPSDSPRSARGEPAHVPSPFASFRAPSSSKYSARHDKSRGRRSAYTIIDELGRSTMFQADKRALVQRFKLRLPIRDMRLVDPNLLTSDTGKIIVRDNVMLVSMEHVRLIIMATQVIVIKEGQEQRPLSAAFSDMLQRAIGGAARDRERRAHAGSALLEDAEDDGQAKRREVAPLPFELVVLEVALGDVCSTLARLARELELQTNTAMEALTRDVSTTHLEKVRKVKTRHQRLLARATTMREELERFLEDDDDMAKMCLTRRNEAETAQQMAGMASAVSDNLDGGGVGATGATPPPASSLQSGLTRGSLQRSGSMAYRRMSLSARPGHQPTSPRAGGDGNDGDALASEEADAEALEAVENLLESYFVQIDGTFDKLEAIGEYIEDTEQYINIELDSSRNRLIRLEIILTAGTFALAVFTLVGGILGENVVIPPGITKSVRGFWGVNGVTALVCVLVFCALLGWMKAKKLL